MLYVSAISIVYKRFLFQFSVVKEPPYTLKESGYAGFVLPIDIYFKNEPKKAIFAYDLSLQNTGTITNSERKTFTFKNPSDDFRRKLLKNGGQPITIGGADEKSREMDERSQLISKPKLGGINETGTIGGSGAGVGASGSGGGGGSSSSNSKKHKSKSDDSKNPNSFATLFGAPIQKTSSKVSPDPKAQKTSPNLSASTKSQSQKSEKPSKEKSSDKERKEKNKHSSPAKGASSSGADIVKESKKPSTDDKHEKREEKKKDKTHSKERERSRDKPSKRVPSPKPKSPKRQSPVRTTSSSTGKVEEPPAAVGQLSQNPVKQSSKHSNSGTTETDRPSSSAKKSKKEKKEKSHDKDRDKEKKEKEHKVKDDRSSAGSNNKPTADKGDSTKKDGNNTPKDVVSKDLKSSKIQESKFTSAVTPPEPVIEANTVKAVTPTVEKKPEKDPDRKHKHKKKDKNKERGEKDGKDRKKEKTSKVKEDNSAATTAQQQSTAHPPPPPPSFPLLVAAKKATPDNVATHFLMQPIAVPPPVPVLPTPVPTATAAIKITPLNALLDEIGDKGSSDSEDDHLLTAPETVSDHVPPITEPVVKKPPPPEVLPPLPPAKPEKGADKVEKSDKPTKRGRKESKANVDKDEKKRKRKTKDETQSATTKRKTPSPAAPEPPAKILKKEDPIRNSDTTNSILSTYSAAPLSPTLPLPPPPPQQQQQHIDANSVTKASPQSTSTRIESPSQQRPLSAASSTTMSVTAAAAAAASAPPPPPPVRSSTPCNVTSTTATLSDYMSELKDLQHKIMTLQDNNELQQVVEMIATTGCYEITTKTFDFDLCALDRTTVQRLQDFFSTTSCS